MPLDATILDQYGNPFRGQLDSVGGEVVTETGRSYAQTLSSGIGEVVMDLNGASAAVFDLQATTANLSLVFEGSEDGTNYRETLAPFDRALKTFAPTTTVIGTTINKVFVVGVTGMKRVRCRVSAYTSGSVIVAARASQADFIIYGEQFPVIPITQTAAANAICTLTIPAAGVGLFHNIVGLFISRTSTAALAGTATLVITTTNIPNSLAWSVGNAMTAGATSRDVELSFGVPMKTTTANTATTIVAPAPGAAVLWRINAYYYHGA